MENKFGLISLFSQSLVNFFFYYFFIFYDAKVTNQDLIIAKLKCNSI